MTKTRKRTYGIIGAGPSGLAISLFLNARSELVERGREVGGHAGSFFDHGYTFDNGPHIMFSKDKDILEFMVQSLGENVNRLKRNNKVSYRNRLVKYPFENDLKSLPLEDNFECLYHFIQNPYRTEYAHPKNLREWLLKHFGKGICEKYLFPYNEKVWNIPVEQLSMLWAERIPLPPIEDIIKSAIGVETEGYLHQLYYHYPNRGGYQAISKAWQAEAGPIHFHFDVKAIEKLPDERFRISDGSQDLVYDELISTMPIHELVQRTNLDIPREVREAVNRLIVNPMFAISLGIRGEDQRKITALYFPEPDFLVNRVSFPSTFSPENSPPGHYSLQAEITCRKDSQTWQMSDEEILEHTIDGLANRRLVSRDEIVYTNVRRHQYAYVVYDLDYEKNVKIIRGWFPSQGIHLLGRFSYFEYINVDGAVARALELASQLNGHPVHLINGKIVR